MKRPPRAGTLVISLDFELIWGVRDQPFADAYEANLLGARTTIPRVLETFAEFDVHATWATVGLLFFRERNELLAALPTRRPSYHDAALSSYHYLHELGSGEDDDPLHYARSLVDLIASTPHQEIATHTFSHYYCLEPERDLVAFREDLTTALRVAAAAGVRIESIVFPRNQLDEDHLGVCREVGIRAYRGVESSWLYAARRGNDESPLRRALRLVDSYVNLSGHHSYPAGAVRASVPANVPASRFLRPYSKRLRWLEPLKQRQIARDLTHAATHGLVYHLWWHPHNFGGDLDASMGQLRTILAHYARMRDEVGMESLTMGELVRREGAGVLPVAPERAAAS